jgi:hypothetical protein
VLVVLVMISPWLLMPIIVSVGPIIIACLIVGLIIGLVGLVTDRSN